MKHFYKSIKFFLWLMVFSLTFVVNSKIKMQDFQKNRVPGDSRYGTHMIPLITVVVNTSGPILELGCGDFSTPLLHALCSKTKRYILSTETSYSWLKLFMDLQTDWHEFLHVSVYEDDWQLNPRPELWDNIGNQKHWSVVLVDHRPGERRVIDIMRLRKNTDIFVVHDTEQLSYGYESVLKSFKYRYIYDRYQTQTTIVSDVIDITKFYDL